MKAIMITVRLWWFYLTYKGIKKAEIRKRFAKDFKGKIFECVSKTNWKKDLMKIPEEEREFFKQFVGKVGLCFESDNIEEIICRPISGEWECYTKTLGYSGIAKASCLENREVVRYLKGQNGKAIHIAKLEIFDQPKEIGEFVCACPTEKCCKCKYAKFMCGQIACDKPRLSKAPQSYCYIEI